MSACPNGLLDHLRATLHRPELQVRRYERLSGGAIQQNIAVDVSDEDGKPSIHAVLRTDSASGVDVSHSRIEEFSLLQAAFDSGVNVPEPLLKCEDVSVIGAPFFLMERVDGIAQPHMLTRKSVLDEAGRQRLVSDLGRALARVHAIPLDDARLAFLERPAKGKVLAQRVRYYRDCLDALTSTRPVLEWALAWLLDQDPPPSILTLCHNDFRTGNLMIDQDRLNGILDWEFAGIGDPHEDLGWFCAPCWRFAARDRPAGGLGEREAFYEAYEAESGRRIHRDTVRVMEVLATIRWAVIALQQGARFDSGQEPTLELGLTGRMIAELEQDLLQLIPALQGLTAPAASSAKAVNEAEESRLSRDTPHAIDLIAAAHRQLVDQVLPGTDGSQRYSALMIANGLSIALAELQQKHNATADTRSTEQCVELCRGLRNGEIENLFDEALLQRLIDDVTARLKVANPKRLRDSFPT